MLFTAVLAGGCGSQDDNPLNDPDFRTSLVGIWDGQLTCRGQSETINVEIRDEGGELVVYTDIPKANLYHFKMGSPIFGDDGRIHIGLIKGTLREDAGELTGAFNYYEKNIPVTLRKTKQELPRPEVPLTKETRTPVWTFVTRGPIWSSPAIGKGRVFFGSSDSLVYALMADSGDLAWSFRTSGPVAGSPAIAGDHLYIQSDDGYLYKLALGSGRETWRFNTTVNGTAKRSNYDFWASTPSFSGDRVYFGSSSGRLHAVNMKTGREAWHYQTAGPVRSKPAIANGMIIFGSFDHHAYALDYETGALRWQYDTHGPVPCSPTIYKNTVIIGSRNSDIHALDIETGDVKWKHFYWTSWVESTGRLWEDKIYIGSSDYGAVVCLDPVSGKEIWAANVGGSPWSSPAVTGTHVFTGVAGTVGYGIDHKGSFVCLDRQTGEMIWRYPFSQIKDSFVYGVGASPGTSGEMVYFGGLDGVFYAFGTE